MTPKKPAKKPIKYMMRFEKGALVPADSYTVSQIRGKGYKVGDLVSVTIKKLNNPKFNRLVHRIGQLCAANIEAFHGMDAHLVLKRLQIEGNIHCELIGVSIAGMQMEYRYPLSLDFETLDDGERHEVARKFCRLIAEKYWKDLSPEVIEEMAESFIQE